MAAPLLLQKTRQRKMIYWGAIVVLFTVSLIHREFLLKPMAYALQLRETSRGEVKLTSSAVRLLLTGSRGLAVTMLWYNAMDKQKRNEWHELELIVESITELQPYFITPWLFQSWNISFNVAVESDRPRDKYYYISRGLELLAEGERRNRGAGDDEGRADPNRPVFPGNPDMRYYMGFTYQLKIGTSDERLTMRSLLEISCIDPAERDPDKFWTTNERGQKTVHLENFARFTQKYPRLVRRLRDQLGFAEPEHIVKFLQDHRDIPCRFDLTKKSELRKPREQFPILPVKEQQHWPDPNSPELTQESIDVFLVSRTWYEFAQKPLPPPNPMPGVKDEPYDKMLYRIPKQMVIQLFRHYPPRAQVYIAETLESEGFFDSDGWVVPGWFDSLTERPDSEFADKDGNFRVGTQPKYQSRLAWQKSNDVYKKYGADNGIYLDPGLVAELTKRAELARKTFNLGPQQQPPLRFTADETLQESLKAHIRLQKSQYYRQLSNFDTFFYQSEAERDPMTVAMRKALFQAERKRKRETPSEATLALYEQGWELYEHAAFAHPRFAQVVSMQDDIYETYQRYLGECQKVRRKLFTDAALNLALLSTGPMADWPEVIARTTLVADAADTPAFREKIVPIRKRLGGLDAVQYYDEPGAAELRDGLFAFTQGLTVALTPTVASTISFPDQARFLLTRFTFLDSPPSGWKTLFNDGTHRVVAARLGLNR